MARFTTITKLRQWHRDFRCTKSAALVNLIGLPVLFTVSLVKIFFKLVAVVPEEVRMLLDALRSKRKWLP